jgi:predicted Zn-dependent protease
VDTREWTTRTRWRACIALAPILIASGCALGSAQSPTSPSGTPAPSRPTASTGQIDSRQAQRLKDVMVPLLQVMDHPIPRSQVRVGIMDDSQINAANAGGGEFYVTTGLLERATDDQLRAVMAHEIAHADLGHVAKAQTLGAGLAIGMVILDQIFPGSGQITPVAGELVARAYGRSEEYAADSHGVTLLDRAGYDGRRLMVETLTWLQQTSGSGGGGFFSTHPNTGDRIQRVSKR